jgi:2-polyprenyl-6-methoxyphenol hydroxylase-like FAD-dependent oxidoreductase
VSGDESPALKGSAVDEADVVIVGGGFAGGALAAVLARDGLQVQVLESTAQYEDRVRGESLMPWGVLEARELGVEETLLAAGAHSAAEWRIFSPEVGEQPPIPIGMLVPGVAGSLNLRHPLACSALSEAASRAGAAVVRSVEHVALERNDERAATYRVDGREFRTRCRLVVGADGRNSTVRRQAGITVERQAPRHYFAGMLVAGLEGVPDGYDLLAGEGDLFQATFHQGDGVARVYVALPAETKHRFSGPGGPEAFLSASAFRCLPFGGAFAAAKPAGPCATFPADDTWTARPFAEGVVLIGDAAGHNNPLIGQGLSLALRDVRTVRDLLRAGDWSTSGEGFTAYGDERFERMRRVRFAADLLAAVFAEGGDNMSMRRANFPDLLGDAGALSVLIANFVGPESAPADSYDASLLDRARSE